jgi:hypothetical protein
LQLLKLPKDASQASFGNFGFGLRNSLIQMPSGTPQYCLQHLRSPTKRPNKHNPSNVFQLTIDPDIREQLACCYVWVFDVFCEIWHWGLPCFAILVILFGFERPMRLHWEVFATAAANAATLDDSKQAQSKQQNPQHP